MKWLNLLLTQVRTLMPYGYGSFVKSWVTGWKLYVLGIAFLLMTIVLTSVLKNRKRALVKSAEKQLLIQESVAKTTIAEKRVQELLKKSQSHEAKKDSLHLVIDKLNGDDLQWAIDTAFNYRQPP